MGWNLMINFLKILIVEKLYLFFKYMYDFSICKGNFCVLEMFLRFFDMVKVLIDILCF